MVHTTVVRVPTFAERMESIEHWVVRQLGSSSHEQRVAGIAVRIFDLTAPLHGLASAWRRHLRIGALLHDVGRIDGQAGHHVRGARMILRTQSLPLSSEERRIAAFLARFHRKAPPSKRQIRDWTDSQLRVGMLRTLLAIFRAADALDSRRVETGGLTLRLQGKRLRIRCFVESNRREANRLFAKRRKFDMIEDILGLAVKIQVRPY